MKIVIAAMIIVLAMWAVREYPSSMYAMGFTSPRPRSGERRTKLYPGSCPNGESWYLVDSDSDSVTVGCFDPDYSPE
jgi:hypothetical protein